MGEKQLGACMVEYLESPGRGVLFATKHMNAIFTLQHMHTHNQLPYVNASVKKRTARPVIDFKQCCHCGM